MLNFNHLTLFILSLILGHLFVNSVSAAPKDQLRIPALYEAGLSVTTHANDPDEFLAIPSMQVPKNPILMNINKIFEHGPVRNRLVQYSAEIKGFNQRVEMYPWAEAYRPTSEGKIETLMADFKRYFERQARQPIQSEIDQFKVSYDSRGKKNKASNEDLLNRLEEGPQNFYYDLSSYEALFPEALNPQSSAQGGQRGGGAGSTAARGSAPKITPKKNSSWNPFGGFKFKLRPRIFRGFVIVQANMNLIDLQARVGANTRTEINGSKNYQKIGLFHSFQYLPKEKLLNYRVDKRIADHYTFRVSTSDHPGETRSWFDRSRFMVLYRKGF